MYVSLATRPTFDSLCKNVAWWVVTEDLKNPPQNCQNWGVGNTVLAFTVERCKTFAAFKCAHSAFCQFFIGGICE